jgi:hypothetical protein
MFPLSLTGTTFSWFASLAPGSINSWYDLEKKFHEHFLMLVLEHANHTALYAVASLDQRRNEE